MIAPRPASFLVIVLIIDCVGAYAQSDLPAPAPAAAAPVGTDIASELNSGQDAAIADAERQIRENFASGTTPYALWRNWLPSLMNTHHYQQAADLSIEIAVQRPAVETIVPLLEFRVKALLALNRDKEALGAAKSYYNVCALKDTGAALDLIEKCLKDKDEVFRFRAEQATASRAAANGAGNAPTNSFLKSVHVDPQPYAKAFETWKEHPQSVEYANLLLAADRPAEAEAIFRELFKSAPAAGLPVCIEGIARSLRAEDGNVARADAWLLALQNSASSPAIH